MTRVVWSRTRRAIPIMCFGMLAATTRPAFAFNAHADAAANDALEKAKGDFAAKKLAAAVARLDKAAKACGPDKCAPATKAAVLRDLGVMQLHKGDKAGANKSFKAAIALQSDLPLDPAYDTPDVREAWERAGGAPKPPPEPPPIERPAQAPTREETEIEAAPYKRIWAGVAFGVDFQSVPSGDNLCARDSSSGAPVNSQGVYCTKLDGTDFPSDSSQNDQLVRAGRDGASTGHSDGGIKRGVVRIMASFDYAALPNLLVGGRAGVTLFKYTGSAAGNQGHAFGRLYFDVRASWIFGKDPLAHEGFAPMVFAGGGMGAFDAHTTGPAAIDPGSGPVTGTVNLWITSGPAFVMAGGGARWAISPAVAATAALRLDTSFGSSGAIPTLGPEAGMQMGF